MVEKSGETKFKREAFGISQCKDASLKAHHLLRQIVDKDIQVFLVVRKRHLDGNNNWIYEQSGNDNRTTKTTTSRSAFILLEEFVGNEQKPGVGRA